jgi:hypothetical protein
MIDTPHAHISFNYVYLINGWLTCLTTITDEVSLIWQQIPPDFPIKLL